MRRQQQGFSLIEVLVAATLSSLVIGGMGGAMVAMARAQARLIRLQNAADAIALARVQVQASPTAPTVAGSTITSPTITSVDGCSLVVIDAAGLPYQLQLAATCGELTLDGWATWQPAPPAPTPPTP